MNNNEIQKLFYQQKAYSQHLKKESVRDRLKKLKILEKSVLVWRERLKQALYEDLKKPPVEADFTEIFQVLTEVRKARKNLRYWTKPKSVNTPLTLFGSSASIHYEPKGVVLIISPWNYPINLTLVPLVGALAAGNTVIIKPSEISKSSEVRI